MRKRSITTIVLFTLAASAVLAVASAASAAVPRARDGVVHACLKTKGKNSKK